MLARQLARRGIASLLIEGGGRAGLGTAYSTEEPAHVLNVRAEGMSAWPEEPDHFSRVSGDPRGFAERAKTPVLQSWRRLLTFSLQHAR